MTDQENLGIDRRTFVKQAAGALLAAEMLTLAPMRGCWVRMTGSV